MEIKKVESAWTIELIRLEHNKDMSLFEQLEVTSNDVELTASVPLDEPCMAFLFVHLVKHLLLGSLHRDKVHDHIHIHDPFQRFVRLKLLK